MILTISLNTYQISIFFNIYPYFDDLIPTLLLLLFPISIFHDLDYIYGCKGFGEGDSTIQPTLLISKDKNIKKHVKILYVINAIVKLSFWF